MMQQFDEDVLECFLENQRQLFPENVAETLEEAEGFLEDCMAVVLHSLKEVREYLQDAGMDVAELSDDDLLEASEVFTVGDGSYLIVEA